MNTAQLLIYPMGLYVFYVAGLFVYAFTRRIAAGKRGELDGRYYKDYFNKSELPREFIILERHMDNQFQMPTIFLATGAVVLAMDAVTMLTVYLAWGFVLSRFAHTYIHLGRNKIFHRAVVYGVGMIMILLMWAQLLFKSTGAGSF